MRVNFEKSVEKHLPRLAKEMNWTEREALGALMLFWQDTQDAEIAEDSQARIAAAVALHFDSDEQVDRFITAMIKAQLAVVLDDGRIRIRGNEKRIRELKDWYAAKVAAGKARAASSKRGASGRFERNQQNQQPLESRSESVRLLEKTSSSPTSAAGEKRPADQESFSLFVFKEDLQRKRKPKLSKPPTDTHRLRLAFEAAYENKYRTKYLNWDGAHGKFAKTLADSGRIDRAIELVPAYFATQLKEPHTFIEGFESFKALLNKLNAKASLTISIDTQIAQQQAANKAQLEEFL